MAGSKEGSMRFTLIVFAICSTLGLSGCTDKSDPTQGGSTSERPIGASNERRECLNSLGPDLPNADLPKSAAAIGAANDFLKRGAGRDLYISDGVCIASGGYEPGIGFNFSVVDAKTMSELPDQAFDEAVAAIQAGLPGFGPITVEPGHPAQG